MFLNAVMEEKHFCLLLQAGILGDFACLVIELYLKRRLRLALRINIA